MHFWAERVRTAMDQMSVGKKKPSFLENAKDLVCNWIEINLIQFVKIPEKCNTGTLRF